MIRKISLIIILTSGLLIGEGWTKKAGSGYYALDFRILNAKNYHDSDGENVEIEGVSDMAFNLYSEYGLTDDLTIKLNFPFYKILDNKTECSGENCFDRDNQGIGDLDLGFRYRIGGFGQTTISAGLNLGIPFNDEDTYGSNEKMALSDGEFNQTVSLEAGHSLYPLSAYLSGSVKFNKRNEGYSDQLYLGAEGGYKPSSNILVNLRLNFLKSLNNGDKKIEPNLLPIHANNQEYLAVKIGGFYNFYKNYGLAITVDFGLYAKNILSAPVFSIGFYIK